MPPHMLLKKGICYIPQIISIFPNLTVWENLKIGTWTFRKDEKRVAKSINQIFDDFPILRTRKDVCAGKLSGGEQRMLEFGRALINRPKVLLVDEPTAGLAPKVASEIYEKLDELKCKKITIIIVDQNVKKAVMLSDYVNIFKEGRITARGSKEEFSDKLSALIKGWLI